VIAKIDFSSQRQLLSLIRLNMHKLPEKSLVLSLLLVIIHTVNCQSQSTSPYRDTVVRNYENLTRIDDVLDLFSVDVIGAQWTQIHDKVNTICAQNMMQYLSGLENRKIWALKSE